MSLKPRVDAAIADFSSGDSKNMKHKQLYQEENNNEVEELSKDLSEMGCIVDAIRKPSNICVEHCIYEGSDSEDEIKSQKSEKNYDDDAYSEEFEEDQSDEEVPADPNPTPNNENLDATDSVDPTTVRIISKSRMSMSSSKKPSIQTNSDYGSISVPKTHRVNMSFSNDRLRDIQRHNHILLNKIISARNVKKSSIPSKVKELKKPVPTAALQRKRQQRQIEQDNLILLKKIQRAKSSSCSIRR